jgi:NAD(P)-dependent dehydrogenase (short-subunit alcohol dehydrogenase family)
VVESNQNEEPALAGQTVVVIGGVSGIGLETARRARREGADVIITGDDPDRLQRVGLELEASIAAFEATDTVRLERFFAELPQIDHVFVGQPYSEPVLQHAAQLAATKIRPEGTLILLSEMLAPERARVRVHSIALEAAEEDDIAAAAICLMTTP